MREVCYCGRVGELENREIVLDGGDGSPALRCPGEACGPLDGLMWLPADARWPVLEEGLGERSPGREREGQSRRGTQATARERSRDATNERGSESHAPEDPPGRCAYEEADRMNAQAAPHTRTTELAVPGPRRILGGVGNVSYYVNDPVGHMGRLFAAYGPVVALASGGGTRLFSPYSECPGTVFVYGPELVRKVRTPHGSWELSPLTGTLYPLGEVPPRKAPLESFLVGLWGVNGAEHRLHRKLMLPAFHKKRISAYRDDMVDITCSALDRWRPGETLDVHEELLRLSARIATKTLFGEETKGDEAGGGAERTLLDALALLASPLTQLAPYDLPGLPYRRFLDLVGRFDGQMHEIIARKRASRTEEPDVLSMLISAYDEESGAARRRPSGRRWSPKGRPERGRTGPRG